MTEMFDLVTGSEIARVCTAANSNSQFSCFFFSYCKMKAGVWYVCGFVIAFVYFYVYAVNYIRGVRADSVPIQNIKSFNEFHERVTRQINRHADPLRTIPASRQHIALRRADKGGQPRFQQPIHPRYVETLFESYS